MKTISFFSYKGGAGRSTLAYNIIPILAAEHIRPTAESPIIVVDTDVDSCGMSYLVKAESKITNTNCIQHLLGNPFNMKSADDIKSHPFLSQLIPVGNAYGYPINDAILFLPAKDGMTIGKDAKNNYSETSGQTPYMEPLMSFLEVCDEKFNVPAVIFDSAVGNSALANIANEASTVIICVMRPTTQFVNGTHRYLIDVEEHKKLLSSDKHIVLVPNVIPEDAISINGFMYPDTAVSKICNDFRNFNSILNNKYYFDMLDRDEFGIPAVKRFMWIEDALYIKPQSELNDNEKVALGRYRKLAKIINDIDADY